MALTTLHPLSREADPAVQLATRFASLSPRWTGLSLLILGLVSPKRTWRQLAERRDSGAQLVALLDAAYYRAQPAPMAGDTGPLAHYLAAGQYAGLDPHPLFWTRWYARRIPRAATPTTAWRHFLKYGPAGHTDPNPYLLTRWYRCQTNAFRHHANPLLDLLAHHTRGTPAPDPNPLFDQQWYAATYDCGGIPPLVDFVRGGARLPCSPFLARHPELGQGTTGYLDAFVNAFATSPTALPIPDPRGHANSADDEGRVAVCCVLTGGFDTLQPVSDPELGVDYFLFTDTHPAAASGWQTIRVPAAGRPPILHSRALKMNLMRHLPRADRYAAVVYLDGNVELVGGLLPIVRAFLRNGATLAVVPHPFRRCVYEEAATVMLEMRAPREQVLGVVSLLEAADYPPGKGLYEMNLFCFRPVREADTFFRRWWELYSLYGGRDQLLAPLVAWEQGIEPYPLLASGRSVRDHAAFRYHPHSV
jgi:hypothetical protein